MNDEDFDDIAYQYIVLPNGSIAEGRYLTHKGAANAAQNTGKLGILVAGDFEPGALDFDDDVPTTAQLDATRNLAKKLKLEFATLQRWVGHRDLKDTECPGEELYVHVPGFRSATGLSP